MKNKDLKKAYACAAMGVEEFLTPLFPRFNLKTAKIISYLIGNKEIVWTDGSVSYFSCRLLPSILMGIIQDRRLKNREKLYRNLRYCTEEEAGTKEEIEKVFQKLMSHPQVKEIRDWRPT